MKRNVVASIILASTAVAAPLSAQQQTSYGIVGGYVSASPSVTPSDPNRGSKSGFALGAYLDFRLAPGMAFVPEAMYMQRGSTEGTETNSLNYLEIPLLLRMYMGRPGSMRFFITAGPSIGFNLSCNFSNNGASESCSTVGDGVKSTDVSLMFGAGVGSRRAALSVRYDLGLTDIDQTDPPTIKTNDLLILLSLKF